MPDPIYATQTDLARIGILASALTPVPGAAQDEALDAASRLVDSYLRSQFVLPLVQWGTDITRVTCQIAAYDLMVTRGFNPSAMANDTLRLRYEDSLRWLELCSKGTVTPSVTDSNPGSSEGVSTATPSIYSASQRGWSRRGSFGGGGDFLGD